MAEPDHPAEDPIEETSDETPDDDDPGALRKAAGLAKSAVTGAVDYVSDKRFERTPAGKAKVAAEEGATTFHIRLDLDDISYRSKGKAKAATNPEVDDVIGAIEAEGWRLDNLEYITEAEQWERTDGEDGSVTRGSTEHTSAVLLFRRA